MVARPAVLRTPRATSCGFSPAAASRWGASRREPGRRANETLREVELRRPSYLAAREVTNAQFRRFQPDHSSGRFGPHDLDGEANPVVQITWEEAAAYCNWLSAQEGLPPRYAMRDGTARRPRRPWPPATACPPRPSGRARRVTPAAGPLKYPWGDVAARCRPAPATSRTNRRAPLVPIVLQGYDDGFPVSRRRSAASRPTPWASTTWAATWRSGSTTSYSIPPADAPLDEVDPVGPAAGELHVILGSSFLQGSVTELRLSYRDYATKPRADVGFRIARYAE